MASWKDIIDNTTTLPGDLELTGYKLEGNTIYMDRIFSSLSSNCESISKFKIKTKHESHIYVPDYFDSNSDYFDNKSYSNSGIYSKKNVTIKCHDYNGEPLPIGVNLSVENGSADFKRPLDLSTLVLKSCDMLDQNWGRCKIKCSRVIMSYGVYPSYVNFVGVTELRMCYMASSSYSVGVVGDCLAERVVLYNCGKDRALIDDIIDMGVKEIVIINGQHDEHYLTDPYYMNNDLKFAETVDRGVRIFISEEEEIEKAAPKKAIQKEGSETPDEPNADDRDECVICLEGFESGGMVRLYPCAHRCVHGDCVADMFECPVCRTKILWRSSLDC